mmetsp:Transcript_65720/g.137389  ORF Transcript_65720/g.137389 Transcript_65720/m.137389 type:complete len:518 (+) Transcript_65720:105-1658(+)
MADPMLNDNSVLSTASMEVEEPPPQASRASRKSLTQIIFAHDGAAARQSHSMTSGHVPGASRPSLASQPLLACRETVPEADGQSGALEVVMGTGGRAGRNSIFTAEVEETIIHEDPAQASWLASRSGHLFQLLLCCSLIAISVYVTVFQKIMSKRSGGIDPAAINIDISLFSILAALGIVFYKKEQHILFCEGWYWKVAKFALPGFGFALTSYLGIVAVIFLPADTSKVLEQTRLLVLAGMSKLWFKKGQSSTAWNSLIVITLASICYAQMKEMEKDIATANKQEGRAATDSEEKKNDFLFIVGVVICLGNVVLQSFVSIWCEGILKSEKETPFYIQKFYIEVPGLFCGFLLALAVNPLMVAALEALGRSLGIEKAVERPIQGMKGNWFANPFEGWDDFFFYLVFIFMISKSWVSGFLVKQLSSIVKQLCAVIAVGITYFTSLIHLQCPTKGDFFCLGNLKSATFPMMAMDLCVILSVVGYALAGNEANEREKMKKEAEEARAALNRTTTDGDGPDV